MWTMGNQQGHPAQLGGGSMPGIPYNPTPSYTCACGNPAKNIEENHLFCSGCFFQYTVAKSAGRVDEYWEKKRVEEEERLAKAREEQRRAWEAYDAQGQQAQQNKAQAQQNVRWQNMGQAGMQNALGALGQTGQEGSLLAEQPPAKKPWYSRFFGA
jgi:hypothetical protein